MAKRPLLTNQPINCNYEPLYKLTATLMLRNNLDNLEVIVQSIDTIYHLWYVLTKQKVTVVAFTNRAYPAIKSEAALFYIRRRTRAQQSNKRHGYIYKCFFACK